MMDLKFKMFDSPGEAPLYHEGYHAAGLKEAVVVGNGTDKGLASVDLIFMDGDGKKYVAMTSGALIRSLLQCIDGVEERTKIKK